MYTLQDLLVAVSKHTIQSFLLPPTSKLQQREQEGESAVKVEQTTEWMKRESGVSENKAVQIKMLFWDCITAVMF